MFGKLLGAFLKVVVMDGEDMPLAMKGIGEFVTLYWGKDSEPICKEILHRKTFQYWQECYCRKNIEQLYRSGNEKFVQSSSLCTSNVI